MIYFSAVWCPTCHQMAPSVDRLSSEFGAKLRVIKVDVDDKDSPGYRHYITLLRERNRGGIPYTLLLREEQVVAEWRGLAPYEGLSRTVQRELR